MYTIYALVECITISRIEAILISDDTNVFLINSK